MAAGTEVRLGEFREEAYAFETLTLDARGLAVTRERGAARRCLEELAPGVLLPLIAIPGGLFAMGSPRGMGYPDEQPQHQVAVGPFWLGQWQVTQEQWTAVMDMPAACRCPGPRRPVDNVSWHAAREFCTRLAERTGRRYSLPTEAQWEYACRAGSISPFGFGETLTGDVANYEAEVTYRGEAPGIYRHCSTEAGSFPPNAFGLQDMHGNVWEWCADVWHDSYEGAPGDGSAWETGGDERYRVARGGSWHEGPDLCRSATRLRLLAGEGDDLFGFRVALVA
jgi:formylglycine-generating enzyme required for sulfatase activity